MSTLPGRLRAHPRLGACIAVVILAAAGGGGYLATRSDSAAATSSTTTQTVSTGTVKQSVSATGTLAPAAEENLNFSVSGPVTRVSVTEGQRVEKGQTLATVDSASLSAEVAQAKATVASDQAKVDEDNDNDADGTQLSADTAALTAAKNQLSSAQDRLAAATLTAPISGVVATVNLTVGQSVSGTSSENSNSGNSAGVSSNQTATGSDSSTSSPQILVISTASWVVNASVDATSVGLIKPGEQAELSVTGSEDTVYGTIASIGLVSTSTSGTASYPVVVDVTGSPSGLHDGAGVTATLIYKQVADVVVVPATALHRSSGGGEYVEKLDGDKTVQSTVRVGLSAGGQTQIVSGLSEGDKIVVPQIRRQSGNGGTRQAPSGRTGEFPGGFPGGGQFPGGAGGGRRGGGGLGG